LHVLHRHHDPRRRGLLNRPHAQRRAHDAPLMATETATAEQLPVDPSTHEIARVRVPTRSWRGELRAIRVVWRRELIRFSRDRLRIVTSLVQPFLFLFVLGTGL